MVDLTLIGILAFFLAIGSVITIYLLRREKRQRKELEQKLTEWYKRKGWITEEDIEFWEGHEIVMAGNKLTCKTHGSSCPALKRMRQGSMSHYGAKTTFLGGSI